MSKRSRRERIKAKIAALQAKAKIVVSGIHVSKIVPKEPLGSPGTLTLIVNQEVQDPTLSVRWCVDSALIETLKERGALDPHVLIVLAEEIQESYGQTFHLRKKMVFPLEQGMGYLQLLRPGNHILAATIVWNTMHDKDTANADRQGVRYWLLNAEQFERNGRFSIPSLCYVGESHILLNIPSGIFAPEPSARMSSWVNLWFRSRPKDECDYRKRLLIAIFIQPIAMGIWIPFRYVLGAVFMICITLVFGVLPWRYDFHEYINPSGTLHRIWISTKRQDSLYWQVWNALSSFFKNVLWKSEKQNKVRAEKPAPSYDYSIFQSVACDVKDSWSLSKVPLPQRINLMFWDVKARVCKPFQS